MHTGLARQRTHFRAASPSAASAGRFFGIGCTLAALAPGYGWFGAALAMTGAAALIFTNGTNSIMQLCTEPTMRGRVMALRVGIALGGTPLGAPLIGVVVNHFGPRWALGVGALSGFAAAVVALFAITISKPRSCANTLD